MDEKLFNIVKSYGKVAERMYDKLDREGFDTNKLDDLFEEVYSLHNKYLKLGKELDDEKYIGKETALRKAYKDLPAYTRIELIYKYDNGFCLCSTTDLETYLIPSDFINL